MERPDEKELTLLRWGLVPFWAKEPSIGNRMINARAETVSEKPAYRVSFRKRRCLVVADGFYEWQPTDGRKQPFFFHRVDGYPFLIAGLWDRWDKGEDLPLETFTILTTGANEVVAPIHHRMPAILKPEVYEPWLDPVNQNVAQLEGILRDNIHTEFVNFPVSKLVNSTGNNSPSCIEPL